VSKKFYPFLYGNSLYENGQDFLDILYVFLERLQLYLDDSQSNIMKNNMVVGGGVDYYGKKREKRKRIKWGITP